MRRTALVAALLLAVAACTTTEPAATTTTLNDPGSAFPVTVEADNGSVTIESRPERIISLSTVATEMLFEIGAGSQVVAVDDQSNYPAEAPVTALSGFTPNLEAILSFDPDLVVITFDPGELVSGLETAGVPVLSYTAAFTVDDVYGQIEALGTATGNFEEAASLNDTIQADLAALVAESGDSGEDVTYYHEIDATYYSATSSTFFGEIYSLFGMVNIADEADSDGAASGYPQLSSEYIVALDPDIVFLADVLYGESLESVGSRPGWDVMDAVRNGNVVELDSDVASRWGPRIVEFARTIAVALERYDSG
jgi:iron complex transport system substrate-binding protein